MMSITESKRKEEKKKGRTKEKNKKGAKALHKGVCMCACVCGEPASAPVKNHMSPRPYRVLHRGANQPRPKRKGTNHNHLGFFTH